jgi:hypothetical protein
MRGQVGGMRTSAVIAVALTLLAVMSGCASSRTAVVGSVGTNLPAPAGWKQIHYGNVLLDVPAGWPVIDLGRNPHQCVLFNVHAVYLGQQDPAAMCPAQALGRADALQVEPLDAQTRQQILASSADETINGERVANEPDGSATRSVVASFPGLGVALIAVYATDPTVATHIVHSVQRATGTP